MGQSIKGVFSSKAFKEADTDGRVLMVNNHWDSVGKATGGERSEELDLLRATSIGAIEAYAEADGLKGDGTFTEQKLETAKSFDDVFAMLDQGAYQDDPEMLSAALKDHDRLMQSHLDSRVAGAKAYTEERDRRTGNVAALQKSFGDGATLGGALSAASEARDKSVFKEKGKWSAPAISQTSRGEFLGGTTFSKVFKGLTGSAARKIGVRQFEGEGQEGEVDAPIIADSLRTLENSGINEREVSDAWNDFVNINRKWGDDELTRVLSSGQVIVNTQDTTIITDLDKVKASIMDSATNDFAKTEAIARLDEQRSETAVDNANGLYMLSDSFLTKEDLHTTVLAESEKGTPFPDIISGYIKRNPLTVAQKTQLKGFKGLVKLNQAMVGAAAIAGSESASNIASELREANDMISQGMQTRDPHSGLVMKSFGTILEEAPSLAFQMLATRGIGVGVGSVAARVGPAATAATRMTKAAQVATGLGVIGGSAAQSAGLTYADVLNKELAKGTDAGEAHELARIASAKAGITTGFLTSAFHVTGFGGVETGMQSLTMGRVRAEAAKRGINFREAALRALKRQKPINYAKGIFGEAAEEGLDELFQTFMLADDNETVANAWANALEGAKAGALLSGVVGIAQFRGTQREIDRLEKQMLKSESDKQRDFEAATQLQLLEQFSPEHETDTEAAMTELDPDNSGALLDASRAVEEVWADDDGDVVGVFNEAGNRVPKLWVNGEWTGILLEGTGKHSKFGMRRMLAASGFHPRMFKREVSDTITAEGGKPFKTEDEAIDHLLANDLSSNEYEVVPSGDGFVAQPRIEAVAITEERGRQLAQQELDNAEFTRRRAAERTDRRIQRAINEAQAPLTGSSIEQTDAVKREAEKVFKPKFKEAKEVLASKEASEKVAEAFTGHAINPELYSEDHEKAAAEFLIANGVTNIGQAVAAINSEALANAEGTFPNALRNALNVVIQSSHTRNIPAPDSDADVGAVTDPDVQDQAAAARAETTTPTIDQYLVQLDATIEGALNMTPEERADIAERARAMTPPTVVQDAKAEQAEAISEAEARLEALPTTLTPQAAGEFNSRNSGNIESAKAGNHYGKGGIPRKFLKTRLSEQEIEDLDTWIGNKEDAAANYSDKPSVDPNVEAVRQDEIDLALDIAEAHRQTTADLEAAQQELSALQVAADTGADTEIKDSTPDPGATKPREVAAYELTAQQEERLRDIENFADRAKKTGLVASAIYDKYSRTEMSDEEVESQEDYKAAEALLENEGFTLDELGGEGDAGTRMFNALASVSENLDDTANGAIADLGMSPFGPNAPLMQVDYHRSLAREKARKLTHKEKKGRVSFINQQVQSQIESGRTNRRLNTVGKMRLNAKSADLVEFIADNDHRLKPEQRLVSEEEFLGEEGLKELNAFRAQEAGIQVTADTGADTEIKDSTPDPGATGQTAPPGVTTNESNAAASESAEDPDSQALAEDQDPGVAGDTDPASNVSREAIEQAKRAAKQDFLKAKADVEAAAETAEMNQDINSAEANQIYQDVYSVPEGDVDGLAKAQERLNKFITGDSSDIGSVDDQHMTPDNTAGGADNMLYSYSSDTVLNPTQESQSTQSLTFDSLLRQLRFNFGLRVSWVDSLPGNALGRYSSDLNSVELSRNVTIGAETPLHEVGHAFLAAVRAQNPKLYTEILRQLSQQVKNDPMLQSIRERIIKGRPDADERLIVEEILATYLGESGAAALSEEQAWRDTSTDESKSILSRAWAAIRLAVRRIFTRLAPKDISHIGPKTKLRDLAKILVNPGTRLDLTNVVPLETGDPRRMLREHALGTEIVSDFLLNSLDDASGEVVVLPNESGGFDLALGNWRPLMDSVRNIGQEMNSEFTPAQREQFLADLEAYPHDTLGDDFWTKWQRQRYRITALSNLGYEPSKQDLMFIVNETMNQGLLERAYKGKATSADYDMLKRIAKVHGISEGFAKPSKITVPESGATAMRSALGKSAAIATAVATNQQATLDAEGITALKDAVKTRRGVARDLKGYATDKNTDPLAAMALLQDAYFDEAAASANLDKVRGNPLEKRGYTRQQYIDGNIAVEDQVWADKQMERYVQASPTKNQKSASLSMAEGTGFDVDLYSTVPAPTTAPAPSVPVGRIGDGTKSGFYNNIPSDPSFKSPIGRGKLAPKADGTPPTPFKEIHHAQSFRAKVAVREGIEGVEMKIVPTEKEGRISYHVVVPDNSGRAGMARTGMMSDPDMFFESLKDPVVFPTLPSFDEVSEYLEGAPKSLLRRLRRMRLKSDKNPEDVSGDASNGGFDEMRQNELVDRAVAVNKYQQQWSRMVAHNKMRALQTKHEGAFISSADPYSKDAGKVDNLVIPPGKSPYLSDILEEAMVDTTSYPFNADQIAMITDMRAVLENMRQLMREAKLDKKFLSTHGLEVGEFLDDPKKGESTWRQYFPRLVVGSMNDNGQFNRKQYVGPGSTTTVQKTADKDRMTDSEGNWLSMQDIKNSPTDVANVVYATSPFYAMEHFLTNSYSAVASVELAANVDPLVRGTGKETTRHARASQVTVLKDSLFDTKIAARLNRELAGKSDKSPTIQLLQDIAGVPLQIVLGGFDIAAPLTVAARFTLAHPLKEFAKGRPVGGFFDVARVLGGALTGNVIPGTMNAIAGRVLETTKSVTALDKLHSENLQPYSELAALGSMLGRATDYQEQTDRLRQASRDTLATDGGFKNAIESLRFRALEWGGGLGDFHRNFSEMGKMLMWKSMRTRFVDSATGNLRTDQESINRMMEEVRALDRSFGYSNDIELSPLSTNAKGAMRIALTAPTMYYSMTKNLTTKRGLAHTAEFAIASLMWFFAMGKSADMEDDEILRRMNPMDKDFLTLEMKGPGDRPMLRLSLSNFYRSIAKMAGKQAAVAEKVINGDKVLVSDLVNPSADFFRGRRSPFVSGITQLLTGEDFLGRPAPIAGSLVGMVMPLTLEEPVKVWMDRALSLRGTAFQLTSPETYDTYTEELSMNEKASVAIASLVGTNIYAESDRQRINRKRDVMFQDLHGVDFADAEEWMIPDQIRVAREVQKSDGTPFNWGGFSQEFKTKENRRWLKHFDRDIRVMIEDAGVVESINYPGSVQIGKRPDEVIIHLERGTLRNRIFDMTANHATNTEGGLRSILDRLKETGSAPPSAAQEIKDVLSASRKAMKEELTRFSGAD